MSAAIAMQSEINPVYPQKADFVIRKDIACDYMEAADFINAHGFDVVLLQHEFNLFSNESGVYIVSLLKRLNISVITTLHTVMKKPDQSTYQSLIEICDCSRKVIVMDKYNIITLKNIYGVSESKTEWIPQGVSAVSCGDEAVYQYKFDLKSPEMTWSDVGRAYWKQVKTQLPQPEKKTVVCGFGS